MTASMALSNAEGLKSSESKTVVVTNLPDNMTKDLLESCFSAEGRIHHCFLVRDRKTRKFQGKAYIIYADKESADMALGKVFAIGSQVAHVALADDKRKKNGPLASQQAKAKVNFSKEAKEARKQQKSRIIIRNLPFKANEDDLLKSFEVFGKISNVNIPRKADGAMRGFAFVQFEKTLDAIKAVKGMNMKQIRGRNVAVDFTVAKRKFEDVRKRKEPPSNGKNERSAKKLMRKNNAQGSDEDGSEESSEEGEDEDSILLSGEEDLEGKEPLSFTERDMDPKEEEFFKKNRLEIYSDGEMRAIPRDQLSDQEISSEPEVNVIADGKSLYVPPHKIRHGTSPEKSNGTPADNSGGKPLEKSKEKYLQKSKEKSLQKSKEKPLEKTREKSLKKSKEKSLEKSKGKSSVKSKEKQRKRAFEVPELDSDSDVELLSDGETLVVQKMAKARRRVLKQKPSKRTGNESEADESEDEEDMEVDDDDDADDDDENDGDSDNDDEVECSEGSAEETSCSEEADNERQKKKMRNDKNKKDKGTKAKTTEEDSDSDWGHTPTDNSTDDDDAENRDSAKAKRRAEMIKNEDLSRTVFLSNVSFDTTENTLQQHLKKFGPYKFCLLCKDKILNRSKGTAFVKFEEKSDAEKCISSIQAGELTLDGKVLSASSAMKRDRLKEEIEKKVETKKQPKDNRNLYLAREGFIRGGTNVAADISDHDLKLRVKLEANKKKSLKNLHNFVSPTRLCVHNLPPSCDDRQLRKIFAAGVDRSAKITEARVMLNMKRLGPDGKGASKGFGFVNFEKHEDALKALRYVNNNPEIFTDQMRPVVAFSIENKAALMVKQRRLQRSRDKLAELHQMKASTSGSTNRQQTVDYAEGERSAFEGLRAQTDMKTLPRRVGEKVRADSSRRNHQMRLKRLAKKAKRQPEFKKKKEKKRRGPTKAQLKETVRDRNLNNIIDKRRKNLKRKSD